eukprot:9276500-Prorocentrum_lima.AAC.1
MQLEKDLKKGRGYIQPYRGRGKGKGKTDDLGSKGAGKSKRMSKGKPRFEPMGDHDEYQVEFKGCQPISFDN